jgi:Tol biopolymer transport system component
VGGRNTTNLTKDSPAADYAPAFSPDGEKIAFRSERDGGGIYVMGATGESVRRLTDFGFDPAWSPGGGEIVVSTEPIKDPTSRATESALWVVDVATGKKHLVFEKDGVEPRWSPHGTRIAFWGIPRQNSPNQGQRDIATVASDGSPAKTAVAVTNDPAFDWSPEWSPDGRFLYFASDRGGTMNLWRVAIEESSGRVLGEPEPVTTPSTWVSHFRFSRDGSALVFAALDERSTVFHAVFDPAAETIAGSPAPVLKGSRLISTLELSPDGKWIVFDSPRGQREDLFLVRSDGSDYRQLIDEPFQHRVPRWSPDGSRISFYSNRSGKPAVWAIRPDGSGLEVIAPAVVGVYRAWSPDGKRMATGSATDVPVLFDLSRLPGTEAGSFPSRLAPWSWSPDGARIAGNADRPDRSSGIGFFSFSTRSDTILDEDGRGPLWLSDNVRLLYEKQGGIILFDTRTARAKPILPPGSIATGWAMKFSHSLDDRGIAYLQTQRDGDIWLMDLRPGNSERKP